MPSNTSDSSWDDDKPKANPTEDILGFASFAERLAKSIHVNNSAHGLVLGIYGRWGSGKSTLLNFIKWYLINQKPKTSDSDVIIMEFNPWLFSDSHRSLVYHFLHELLKILAPHKAIGKKLKTALARFLEAKLNSDDLTLVGEAITEFRPNLAKRGLQAILRKLSRTESLTDLKAKIHNGLSTGNMRIVVFIDDIDRLESGEMRQIFQLVKAVADFPRITYLLALDPQLVESVIDQKEYLDKIIQCPFVLPAADRRRLDELLEKRLLAIPGVSEARINKERWYYIYSEGIRNIITSPRRVVRFTNALTVSLAAVADEVDICDFVGIELLRIFYPELYATIRENKVLFTGHASQDFFGIGFMSREKAQAFHEAWLKQYTDAHFIKPLVDCLFPNLKPIWNRNLTIHSDTTIWMTQLRICEASRFDTYFQFSVPASELSNADLGQVLNSLVNERFEDTMLLSLVGADSKWEFLANGISVAVKEKWNAGEIAVVIRNLFQVADKLIEIADLRERGFMILGFDYQLLFLLAASLAALPKENAETLIQDIARESPAYFMLGKMIDYLADPKDTKKFSLSTEIVQGMQADFISRLRQLHAHSELLNHAKADYLIWLWSNWQPDGDFRTFAQEIMKNPIDLRKYLLKLIHKGRQTSSESPIAKEYEFLSLKRMPDEFMKALEEIASSVHNIATSSADDIRLRRLFDLAYDAVKRGAEPSYPENASKVE